MRPSSYDDRNLLAEVDPLPPPTAAGVVEAGVEEVLDEGVVAAVLRQVAAVLVKLTPPAWQMFNANERAAIQIAVVSELKR